MTDLLELPETSDPFADGLLFAAGSATFFGGVIAVGFAMAELLKRKDCRECER